MILFGSVMRTTIPDGKETFSGKMLTSLMLFGQSKWTTLPSIIGKVEAPHVSLSTVRQSSTSLTVVAKATRGDFTSGVFLLRVYGVTRSRRDSFSYSGLFDFRDKHNHSKILTRSFGTGAIVKAGSLSATNGELAIKFTSSVKIIGIRLLGSKSIPARTPFSEIDWTNHFVQSVSFENGSWVEPKLILKGG